MESGASGSATKTCFRCTIQSLEKRQWQNVLGLANTHRSGWKIVQEMTRRERAPRITIAATIRIHRLSLRVHHVCQKGVGAPTRLHVEEHAENRRRKNIFCGTRFSKSDITSCLFAIRKGRRRTSSRLRSCPHQHGASVNTVRSSVAAADSDGRIVPNTLRCDTPETGFVWCNVILPDNSGSYCAGTEVSVRGSGSGNHRNLVRQVSV